MKGARMKNDYPYRHPDGDEIKQIKALVKVMMLKNAPLGEHYVATNSSKPSRESTVGD